MLSKSIYSCLILLLIASSGNFVLLAKTTVPKPSGSVAVDNFVFNEELFGSEISSLMPDAGKLGFEWMSRQKTSLRSAYEDLTFLDEEIGELVVRSEEGKVGTLMVSIFNRGDDGKRSLQSIKTRTQTFARKLSDKLGSKPRDYDRKSVGNMKGMLWKTGSHAYLMEVAVNQDEEPEFLRLLVKPVRQAHQRERMTNRSQLSQSVVEKDNGDVYIEGIPMVDQGAKGYCAVASAQRIFNYYGNRVDMHELAQAAGTTADSGTSLPEMVGGLKKSMDLVRSRVLILYEKMDNSDEKSYDQRAIKKYLRELSRDCRKYNQFAKKQDKPEINLQRRHGMKLPTHRNGLTGLPAGAIPELWCEVQMEKSEYDRFLSKIRSYIDQGIPVAWALRLGMFKEEGLPQTSGGHMRLIIGYNEKTDEIIYSDSWGAGHDYKKMPAGHAFCMTMATMVLVPNK